MKSRNPSWNSIEDWDNIEKSYLTMFYPQEPSISNTRIDATPFESRDSLEYMIAMIDTLRANPITATCYRFLSHHCIVFLPNSTSDNVVWGTEVHIVFPAKMYSGSKDYWSVFRVSAKNEVIKRWQVDAMDFEGVAQKASEAILDVRKEQK